MKSHKSGLQFIELKMQNKLIPSSFFLKNNNFLAPSSQQNYKEDQCYYSFTNHIYDFFFQPTL